MDDKLETPPPTSAGPGACQPGTNRSLNYFWPDGSMFIRPDKSTTVYSIWGSRLARYSVFFSDLAALPQAPVPSVGNQSAKSTAVEDVKRHAETSGGDGKTENSPLWIQPTESQFEIFLECVFLELKKDMNTHTEVFWQTALEMGDFFDAKIVRDMAILSLEGYKEFDPTLRLSLAMQYGIKHWVDPSFRTLLRSPLPSLSSDQINMLGFSAYIILAETQSKITKHRILCSLTVPSVVHAADCPNAGSCTKAWAHAWWGEAVKHGVAVALIHPNQIPASQILKALPNIVTSWHMSAACRSLTVRSLSNLSGILLKEEEYIKDAVNTLQRL